MHGLSSKNLDFEMCCKNSKQREGKQAILHDLLRLVHCLRVHKQDSIKETTLPKHTSFLWV